MRYSLLEMTQLILSDMDSDEVNSISDSVESLQVAKIIKNCYYSLAVEIGLTEHETVFQLNASGSNDKPCQMSLPTNVTKMHTLYYNIQDPTDEFPEYRLVKYLPFGEFMARQNGLTNDGIAADTVESQLVRMNGEDFTLKYYNNEMPMYFTTADDNLLIFNAYDNTIDTTLQKSKTMCNGKTYPAWTETDSFFPDMDPTQFPLLIDEARARCFSSLKQQENREAVSSARRQKIIVQKRKRSTPDLKEVHKVARFGRK